MRYFKLKNPIKQLRAMLREVDNYYYFIRQMEIMDDNGELKVYKLKFNKEKHFIYGAINLPPELLLYHSAEELETLEKTFFGNEMVKLNDMFIEHNIIELYDILFERIKTDEYYAYVFNIHYNWKHCNRRSVTKMVITAIFAMLSLTYAIIAIVSA